MAEPLTYSKKLGFEGAEIEYTLKISKCAKQMRLSVYHDGSVVVSTPRFLSQSNIERFILEKAEWIFKNIRRFKSAPKGLYLNTKRGDFAKYKEVALSLVKSRLEYFNKLHGFSWRAVRVRNQKTRWGSCSRKGVLSFNYKIALMPGELSDYVIVHELCHLGAFNHSAVFWALVEKSVPNHKEVRARLKSVHS